MTTTARDLVVLGAGTAGTMVVNKLHRALPATDWTITVVDRDDIHDYQPGYLFLPFGTDTARSRCAATSGPSSPRASRMVLAEVDRVDPARPRRAPVRRPRPRLRRARHRHGHQSPP